MTRGEWVRYLDIHIEEDAQRRELRITIDRHQPGAIVHRRDMAITDEAIRHMDHVEAMAFALRAAQLQVDNLVKEVVYQNAQLDRYRQSDRDWRWNNWIRAWTMIGLRYAVDAYEVYVP